MHDSASYAAMPSAPRLPPERGAELAPRMFWMAPTTPMFDADVAPDSPLLVYLNHGRWIAECPDCHGAQLACWTDHRFMCNECGNVTVGGLWRATVWPADRAGIEAVCSQRPEINQNWLPGETVAALKAESAAHGLVR